MFIWLKGRQKNIEIIKDKMKKTKFIVIEGGEGSGKSTLIKMAKERLVNFVYTREPGGSLYAEQIRDIALKSQYAVNSSNETQFGLMWAARHDNLYKTIIPALKAGSHVISDRFDSATYAYQVYKNSNNSFEKLFWMMRKVFVKDNEPDLYIILDVRPEVGLKRVADRKGEINHFDEKSLGFHKKIRSALLFFAKKMKKSVIIDANKPLESVSKDFFEIIDNFIKNGKIKKHKTQNTKTR